MARINGIFIGSAVLNPPGQDASGRAEKGMTAAWLAGFNRRKWIGVQEYGLGLTKMAMESLLERQCRGSTNQGEMLVGQHGEETAVWRGWDSLEKNGTIIVDDEDEFWLLQVMAISEVDSGRRKGCFGFKKICPVTAEYCWEKDLDLRMREIWLRYLVSKFGDDWSKMKKTKKKLANFGPKLEPGKKA